MASSPAVPTRIAPWALHGEAFYLAGDLQLMSQSGVFAQNLSIGFRHQLQQIAVQRYLLWYMSDIAWENLARISLGETNCWAVMRIAP